MKKISKIVTMLVAMILILPVSASAQTADEVVSKAANKLNTAKSITAKFSGSASGTLTVSGKMFAMVTGGFGIWYDGNDMWTYTKRAGETSLTTPTPSELNESNPIEIIKTNAKAYKAEKLGQSGTKYTIKLTPKAKGDNIKSATIVINTSTWLPESIDMILSNDSRMTVNINSITEGQSLPASAFKYPEAKYPGVEVVDLR